MSEVQEYRLLGRGYDTRITPVHCGEYVSVEDYESLEAKVDDLQAVVDAAVEWDNRQDEHHICDEGLHEAIETYKKGGDR